MAKRKGKVDLIEKTLDGELESGSIEVSAQPAQPNEPVSMAEPHLSDALSATASAKKSRSFKLQFLGRQYVEERFPKSLHWADRFAQEWVSEGDFEYLEIPNPRAKEAIVMGLQNIRAVEKAVEKKVEETYSEYSEKLAPYAKRATKRVEELIHQLRR